MKKLLASLGLGLALVGTAQAYDFGFIVKNNTSHDITVQAGSSETAAKSLKEMKVAPGQQEKFVINTYRDGVSSNKTTDDQNINKAKASFQMMAITGSNGSEFKQIDFSVENYKQYDANTTRGGSGYLTLYYGVGNKQFDTYCSFSGTQYNTCWFDNPGVVTYDYQDINGKTKVFIYEDIRNVANNANEFKYRGEYFIDELPETDIASQSNASLG